MVVLPDLLQSNRVEIRVLAGDNDKWILVRGVGVSSSALDLDNEGDWRNQVPVIITEGFVEACNLEHNLSAKDIGFGQVFEREEVVSISWTFCLGVLEVLVLQTKDSDIIFVHADVVAVH